jgi:hypothetical protein
MGDLEERGERDFGDLEGDLDDTVRGEMEAGEVEGEGGEEGEVGERER